MLFPKEGGKPRASPATGSANNPVEWVGDSIESSAVCRLEETACREMGFCSYCRTGGGPAVGVAMERRRGSEARRTPAAKTGGPGGGNRRSARARERCVVAPYHRGGICRWRASGVCGHHQTSRP